MAKAVAKKVIKKRRERKNIEKGAAHISSTFNNTIITITDAQGNAITPEAYLPNTHFNELKALFLFDRELRFLFLKYLLIFENSFKTVISYEDHIPTF